MLNTLTNHGFFPHDGQDIDRETTENALFDALNINKTLGSFLFDFALTAAEMERIGRMNEGASLFGWY